MAPAGSRTISSSLLGRWAKKSTHMFREYQVLLTDADFARTAIIKTILYGRLPRHERCFPVGKSVPSCFC